MPRNWMSPYLEAWVQRSSAARVRHLGFCNHLKPLLARQQKAAAFWPRPHLPLFFHRKLRPSFATVTVTSHFKLAQRFSGTVQAARQFSLSGRISVLNLRTGEWMIDGCFPRETFCQSYYANTHTYSAPHPLRPRCYL